MCDQQIRRTAVLNLVGSAYSREAASAPRRRRNAIPACSDGGSAPGGRGLGRGSGRCHGDVMVMVPQDVMVMVPQDSAEAAAGSCADLVLPSRALSALVAVQRRFRERLAKRKQHELRARSKSLRNLELVGLRNRISQDDELSNLKQQQADAPETTASPWCVPCARMRVAFPRVSTEHACYTCRLLDSSSGSSGPDLIAPANFNQWRDIRPTVKGAKTGLARILHCQLHPFEPARLTWDLLMLLAVTYAVFWGTYVAVFEGTDSFQTWYGTIVEVLFWVDILLNFVTGFVNRECMVSFGRAAVARHYVFGWFVVDIVATVQWRDLALLIAGDDGDGSRCDCSTTDCGL
eukprot:SAG31_NODE_1603_length_7767_cov_10.433359_2_plen_348_part_00